jgi:hypothetical protein
MPRSRRCSWDPFQGVPPGHLRDRLDEAARVRVRRFPEERALRPELDDTASVHHRDPVRERGDDGEVVAHVDRGHAVGVAE